MRIITISREFGSGGRELGKRLADELGFDYYDSEIISAVAQNSGMDENYVEKTLESHGWQSIPLTFRSTLGSADYLQSNKVSLLLEQKKVIEKIAAMGSNCVIVGRNADVILRNHAPFNLFVCASTDAKIKRCMERAGDKEALSEKELHRKMKQIDKSRARTREMISDSEWGQRFAYHLIVNTTDWNLRELAPIVGRFASAWFEKMERQV